MDRPEKEIRPFEPADEAAVAEVWWRSGRAAYPYLPTWQTFSQEKARRVMREVLIPRNRFWVGLNDSRLVAFLAMEGPCIDRLYVDPDTWHTGWGTRFVELAKSLSPDQLELHTHQQNHSARRLYEKHGFVAERFGISPPPESAPDVFYRWIPTEARTT